MMSTVSQVMMEPPAAARAGADLREARERLGWALEDVAAELRIRLPYLEALEEGRLALLPGHVYAVAFMRSYARLLGLDAEEMVRRLKAEAADAGRKTELVFPIPMPDRGFPAGAMVLLGLVLAVGAYTGWYRLSGEGRLPAETVTAIPERLAPLAEQALPPVAAPVVAEATPLAAPTVVSIPQEAVVAAAPVGPVAPPAPAPEPPSIGSAQAATVAPGANDSRIVLHASADAWMLLKDRSGSVLLNRVLKTGESWAVPPRSDLLLTTGNAGGTEILVDGAATPSIGGSGMVRREMPLDPQAVKDGKLAAAVLPAGGSRSGHQ
jgi:cytoskeleton protein RodZ